MILGALEQSNLFGPSNEVLYLKKLVIKSGVRFLILFVLMDAILKKVVYFKNKSGTGVVFLALCMYLMVIIDNSSLFCLYIFVLEDLAFFPTVGRLEFYNGLRTGVLLGPGLISASPYFQDST